MRQYATWELACVIASIGIVVVYHAIFRSSRIASFQKHVQPIWAAIHQQRKSTSTITAIQNLRNVITMCVMFATPCLAFAVLCARLGSTSTIATEMFIVTILWSVAFVNFGISANAAHYLIFNIALYPEDKTDAALVPKEVVTRSWDRSVRQLQVTSRHISIGIRCLLLAIPATFIVIHPLALLCATVAAVWVWYYVDRQFGLQLGSVKVEDVDAGEK